MEPEGGGTPEGKGFSSIGGRDGVLVAGSSEGSPGSSSASLTSSDISSMSSSRSESKDSKVEVAIISSIGSGIGRSSTEHVNAQSTGMWNVSIPNLMFKHSSLGTSIKRALRGCPIKKSKLRSSKI